MGTDTLVSGVGSMHEFAGADEVLLDASVAEVGGRVLELTWDRFRRLSGDRRSPEVAACSLRP
jgi:hypothetical protein